MSHGAVEVCRASEVHQRTSKLVIGHNDDIQPTMLENRKQSVKNADKAVTQRFQKLIYLHLVKMMIHEDDDS